jgi:hypothetical protein
VAEPVKTETTKAKAAVPVGDQEMEQPLSRYELPQLAAYMVREVLRDRSRIGGLRQEMRTWFDAQPNRAETYKQLRTALETSRLVFESLFSEAVAFPQE